MPKERNFNPVQAQRKADKAKAIKKGKAEQASRRNEKLAKQNPERLQTRINDLKQITTNGGKLSKHEESILEGLEKELKAVTKARDALGDKAPTFARYGSRSSDGQGVLGKRRRGPGDAESSDSDIPDDVKSIPMPRDTPPPIPKEILDEWYAKRRASRNANANANDTPLGEREGRPPKHMEEPTAPVESKSVYEAKPVIRNLQQEAVSAFVPQAVRMKIDKGKGQGGLIEPEEADRLEKEGYMKSRPEDHDHADTADGPQRATVEEADEDDY